MKLSQNNPSTSFLTGKTIDSYHICNKKFGENYLFCAKDEFVADSDQEILTDSKGYRYKRQITPHLYSIFMFKKL